MARGPELTIDIEAKRFPGLGLPLFEGFRLGVTSSSVVALVGPSGVGKSTLLRMVGGIDAAFTGSVLIDGIAAADVPPAGFVFQDSRLLPWLTALDNIRAVRAETTRQQASALLAQVGLAGHENAYPHQLSGGMQRRVALARAFSVNPRLLLLDEPFVSLDQALVAELQAVLLGLIQASTATVILVTHLAEDAARLADRAVVLGGRPARITGDLALHGARGHRSPAEVLRLSALIAALSPAAG